MPVSFAQRMAGVRPSAIRELLRLGADPEVISFGGGYPDATLFPFAELAAVAQAAILENGQQSLQYTMSNGTPRLRAQIAERMQAQGVTCTAEDVLVLSGGQQGLDLIAKLYIDRGDLIVTENPTFLGALIAFNPYEPRYLTVPMDEDGIEVERLEALLKVSPGVKLLYTVPDFHNPTGVTMSLARRQRLIELANQYDFMIIEDTPYREIRYEGAHLPTLKSMDTEGRVIFLGSFSKILAPGLRLGWAVGAAPIIQQLGLLKLASDTQCSTLNMEMVSLFFERYDIEQHIQTVREVYRRKKQVMLETIQETFPEDVTYTNPGGGLFTWLSFPPSFDAARFMREHALPAAKVAYVPGATFFPIEQEANHARFSYSTQPEASIVRGMTALGHLLRTHMPHA